MHRPETSTNTTDQPAWIGEALAGRPALLRATEVAEILRVNPRTVKRLLATGRLRAMRTGGRCARLIFARAEVARFLCEIGGAL